MPYPQDTTAADFEDKLVAWQAQDAFLRTTSELLEKNKFNAKVVVKQIIKSPYFRAAAGTNPSTTQLTDIGTGHLLPPEMLNRKIHAITGAWWGDYNDDGTHNDRLSRETYQNYFILYGGMDSDSVISHIKQPNGTVAAVATRMANEMSCGLTAFDFTRSADQRRFFPLVDRNVVPESAGSEVAGSVKAIKQNIAYLHHLFLGENLKEGDAEVERTYKLFLDTWHELGAAQSPDLQWWCQGRWDPTTGKDLDQAVIIDSDPDFTIRSWMAVMSYLMMDYKFIYE